LPPPLGCSWIWLKLGQPPSIGPKLTEQLYDTTSG